MYHCCLTSNEQHCIYIHEFMTKTSLTNNANRVGKKEFIWPETFCLATGHQRPFVASWCHICSTRYLSLTYKEHGNLHTGETFTHVRPIIQTNREIVSCIITSRRPIWRGCTMQRRNTVIFRYPGDALVGYIWLYYHNPASG